MKQIRTLILNVLYTPRGCAMQHPCCAVRAEASFPLCAPYFLCQHSLTTLVCNCDAPREGEGHFSITNVQPLFEQSAASPLHTSGDEELLFCLKLQGRMVESRMHLPCGIPATGRASSCRKCRGTCNVGEWSSTTTGWFVVPI